MKGAYVDTSVVVAIAFDEPGGGGHGDRLGTFDRLYASNLLEAELRSAFQREDVPFESDLLARMDWVLPVRPLSHEIGHVQSAGYIRGADLWHLACALYLAAAPGELAFVTLDARQREVAGRLGFRI